MMRCIYGVLNLWCCANLANYIFIAIFLWWTTSSVCCIIGAMYSIYTFYMHFWYALASLVCWIVGAVQLWWIISWLQYFFGVLYLRCVASLVLCICTFGMLCIGIFGGASLVRLLLCNASLVHCFLVLGAIYFWCCVFGAMHCQLHRTGLLPQWRIYFIIFIYSSNRNITLWLIFGQNKQYCNNQNNHRSFCSELGSDNSLASSLLTWNLLHLRIWMIDRRIDDFLFHTWVSSSPVSDSCSLLSSVTWPTWPTWFTWKLHGNIWQIWTCWNWSTWNFIKIFN